MTEGKLTWMCARNKTDLMWDGKKCNRPATVFRMGMDRCDEHEIDSSPCVWKANMDEENFCALGHKTYGRVYGDACRNPRHLLGECQDLENCHIHKTDVEEAELVEERWSDPEADPAQDIKDRLRVMRTVDPKNKNIAGLNSLGY